MKSESKAKWLEWLNNADESQHITGECYTEKGYCAIGGFLVANGYEFVAPEREDFIYRIKGHEKCPLIVPAEIMKEHGFTLDLIGTITGLNDVHRQTFKQIAKYVEDHV